ncbi:putative acyltransferase [Halanaeroarchaeum sp. HSR-CO]|uniref:polymer-forming cytoskeletal protein n=1 Tax=Halanaeroarchaeum sp. HSR-CO TaxID=2866382 RepID=UPI00217EFD06|nr:polymer-forming cytoskeletal protein [Halanaeroarchaeum sp. HSR-CO]UWG47408.1 putative acyltransferase [Halanaeroarchaeum sp. HSR-CO]
MFGRDPIDRLAIPDGTTVEEHDLVTDGDVLVGGQSTVEFGVRGQDLIAGERVHFGGDIEIEGDCRLDMWCSVDGNALVGADAYLGERVHVDGRLVVGGDLDIGDDVQIDEGFEASGWIVIRNPMPTITFFVVYLTHLLRIGEEEEAEELVEELAHEPDAVPLQIPRGSRVSDETWQVSAPATIGDDCRLHGNIRAHDIEVGEGTNLFGSLRARDDIVVGSGTKVHGDVTSRGGDVTVEDEALILGDVVGEDITIHQDANVDGTIRARGAMRLGRQAQRRPE